MRSSYRGLNRQDISLDISKGEIAARHKANNWTYSYPKLQNSLWLQRQDRDTTDRLDSKTAKNPFGSKDSESWYLVGTQKNYRIAASEMDKIQIESIRRKLERRLQVAKAAGNRNLSGLLEDFEQCDRLD